MKKNVKKIMVFITVLFVVSISFFACNSDVSSEQTTLNSLVNNSALKESVLVNLMKIDNTMSKLPVVTATKVQAPPTSVCRFSGNVNYILNQNLLFPKIQEAEEDIYKLRDNELLSGNTGIAYINAFYEISDLQEEKNFSSEELMLLSDVLPKIVESYKKLSDENFKGVIVDENLKNQIISVMNFYRTIPTKDDVRYHSLINAVQTDIEMLVNRDRSQVLDFLKK